MTSIHPCTVVTQWTPLASDVKVPASLDVESKQHLHISCHQQFPESQLFLADMPFFSKSLFSVKRTHLSEHYEDLVIAPTTLKRGDSNNGCKKQKEVKDLFDSHP